MNSLRKTGLKALAIFVLGLILGVAGNIISPGQDPAGGAMLGGLIAFVCWAVAFVFAIIAFKRSFNAKHDSLTLFLARAPLGIIILLVAVAFILAMSGLAEGDTPASLLRRE
ncbi:MAG: hypothetical protein H0W30_20430 [Gemmatimonadaceae bacterium]|nr:hypothetical protein [Chthoniobacterales bacterium]MBA3560943.1 hypothetical protein [Gemmatimonadaceae bacterium]